MITSTYVYAYDSTPMPTASITSKKSRLKVYNHTNIYLKDNSNFEIELHNPTPSRYLAKIYINGKELSKAGIIINSGQRVFLERYIDQDSKFLFKTFEVDDVKETEHARSQNGLIEVKFYKESEKINYVFNTPYTGTYYYNNMGSSVSYSITTLQLLNEVKSIETGRVYEGEKSNQKLVQSSGDFDSLSSFVYNFQILPESIKAIEAQEIRHYCPGCGLRVKKTSWRFCPNCGEEL